MWYKPEKVKKLALKSQLLTVQILTNDVQVVILCLSYFITTVIQIVHGKLLKKDICSRASSGHYHNY